MAAAPPNLAAFVTDAAALAALEAVIEQRTQAALASAGSANILTAAAGLSRPKLPNPDCFYGTKEGQHVDQWIFLLLHCINNWKITDDQDKIIFAAGHLRGAALTWWQSVANSGNMPATIEDFASALKTQFQPINPAETARDKIASLRQTGAVSSYARLMRNAALEVPGISDDEMMDRFIRGLKPATQREVRMRSPPTFNDAVILAERFDALMYRQSRQPSPFGQGPGPEPMQLGAVTHHRQQAVTGQWRKKGSSNFNRNSNFQSNRPKLTPEARQQLMREGKCFYCRKPGHVALQCSERLSNQPKK